MSHLPDGTDIRYPKAVGFSHFSRGNSDDNGREILFFTQIACRHPLAAFWTTRRQRTITVLPSVPMRLQGLTEKNVSVVTFAVGISRMFFFGALI